MSAGLELLEQEGEISVDGVSFDNAAEAAGLDFDQKIVKVLAPRWQP